MLLRVHQVALRVEHLEEPGRAAVVAQLREARFVFGRDQPEFARRSSWLYPDDGCFARAALAADNLARWSFAPVAKIFVFGDLDVRTGQTITVCLPAEAIRVFPASAP